MGQRDAVTVFSHVTPTRRCPVRTLRNQAVKCKHADIGLGYEPRGERIRAAAIAATDIAAHSNRMARGKLDPERKVFAARVPGREAACRQRVVAPHHAGRGEKRLRPIGPGSEEIVKQPVRRRAPRAGWYVTAGKLDEAVAEQRSLRKPQA